MSATGTDTAAVAETAGFPAGPAAGAPRHRVLVVAGMHRSGTSLLASLAAAAGVGMGEALLPGSKGNRRGHFEDAAVVRFHEECLARRGGGALHPPAPGMADWTPEEEAAARGLIAERDALAAWGFKDPRTTLFLEAWDRLLPGAFYLLVYRHPVEVVLSLLRRGIDLDVQRDPRVAVRAWEVYNRQLLAFHAAHPERSLLWPLAAAVRDLAPALEQLARRTGLPLAGRGLDGLYDPPQLQSGLLARDVDWRQLLPEAIELHHRLDAAADLAVPRHEVPALEGSAAERDLRAANESLLADLLRALQAAPGGGTGNRGETSAAQRSEFSRLKLRLAEQEELIERLLRRGEGESWENVDLLRQLAEERRESARLGEQLADVAREHRRLEATRAMRLVRGWWRGTGRAAALARRGGSLLRGFFGAPALLPGQIVVGCVTENQPKYLAQTLRLVRSLAWFGGSLSGPQGARVLVCAVEAIAAAERRELESLGAVVRIVPRFDARSPWANKLQFFPEALALGAKGLLLLDCDTVVVRDPLPLLAGGAFQAKIADVPSVPHEVFVGLFRHFGLPLPERRYRTDFLGEKTIAYCNSGVIFLSAALAREFVPVWREWNVRLLEAPGLLPDCAHHANQASLSLALAAHPVPFAAAPAALNFPLHLSHLPMSRVLLEADPAILHYHDEIDAGGRLLASRYPLAQERIQAFNRRVTGG